MRSCEVHGYLCANTFDPAEARDEHGRWTEEGAVKLAEYARKRPAGFTVNPETGVAPRTGFMVAPSKTTELVVPEGKLTPQTVHQYLDHWRDALENHRGELYVGGWKRDDGAFVLDISARTKDENTALAIAKRGDQDAYFHLESKNVTSTKEKWDSLDPAARRKLGAIQVPSYPELERSRNTEQQWRRGITGEGADAPGSPGTEAAGSEGQSRTTLTHYAHHEHETLDPKYYGTGISGQEAARKAAFPNTWVDRTYHYLGRNPVPEPGLGPVKTTVKVPSDSLYDYEKDPQKYFDKAYDRASREFGGKPPLGLVSNLKEKLIKDSGYLGYTVPSMKAAVTFHKIPSRGNIDWPAANEYNPAEERDSGGRWTSGGVPEEIKDTLFASQLNPQSYQTNANRIISSLDKSHSSDPMWNENVAGVKSAMAGWPMIHTNRAEMVPDIERNGLRTASDFGKGLTFDRLSGLNRTVFMRMGQAGGGGNGSVGVIINPQALNPDKFIVTRLGAMTMKERENAVLGLPGDHQELVKNQLRRFSGNTINFKDLPDVQSRLLVDGYLKNHPEMTGKKLDAASVVNNDRGEMEVKYAGKIPPAAIKAYFAGDSSYGKLKGQVPDEKLVKYSGDSLSDLSNAYRSYYSKNPITANEFDPDEARDSRGRWTDWKTGGTIANPHYITNLITTQGSLPTGAWGDLNLVDGAYQPKHKSGLDTISRFSDNGQQWSAPRQKLHDEVLSRLGAGVPPSQNPEFILLGGGPASGKSTLVNSGQLHLPASNVDIDIDEFKKQMPEYKILADAKDMRAGTYVHSESANLVDEAVGKTLAAKQNIIFDGTGDSSVGAVETNIDRAHAAGYKVRAEYVTCDVDSAIQRAKIRAQQTGRAVPETVIRTIHRNVSRIYPQVVKDGKLDSSRLWDTEGVPMNGQPVLVAESHGPNLTIHDQARWNKFLAKGNQ